MSDTRGLVDLNIAEHIGPNDTGDNIEAKKVVGYVWDGQNWSRPPTPLIDVAIDDITLSGQDSFGIPHTITYKKNGSTVRTLNLSVDASGNVTEIARS